MSVETTANSLIGTLTAAPVEPAEAATTPLEEQASSYMCLGAGLCLVATPFSLLISKAAAVAFAANATIFSVGAAYLTECFKRD